MVRPPGRSVWNDPINQRIRKAIEEEVDAYLGPRTRRNSSLISHLHASIVQILEDERS